MKPALWSVLVLAAAGNAPEPGRPEAAGLHEVDRDPAWVFKPYRW